MGLKSNSDESSRCIWLILGLFAGTVLVAGYVTTASLASGEMQVDSAAVPISALKLPRHLRTKRYTLTPGLLKWDHFNLTYRIVSFPRNLINESDTRKGIAAAFRMWSEVTAFHFKEVSADQESDLKIGFYGINHTDCLQSHIHHCFDGTTGELAHAYFPQTGEIHFDDSEYWIVGNTRFSWKKDMVISALLKSYIWSSDRNLLLTALQLVKQKGE